MSVVAIVITRILKLNDTFTSADGCMIVLEDGDRKNVYTKNDVHRLWIHCQCMFLALSHALENTPIGKSSLIVAAMSWATCQTLYTTSSLVLELHPQSIFYSVEIMKYFLIQHHQELVKKSDSPIFRKNSKLKKKVIAFCRNNINTLIIYLTKE